MRLVFGVALLILAHSANAQSFTEASELLLDKPTGLIRMTVADLDGDGRSDIYQAGTLYRQQPDGTFINVIGASGITAEGLAPLLALPGDPNVDGLPDIVILNQAPNSRYYENSTAYRYLLANGERNLNTRTLSIGGAWGDFDVDGRIDLFVGSADGAHELFLTSSGGQFTNVSQTKRTNSFGGGCGIAVNDIDNDLDLDVYVAACGSNTRNSLLVYDHVRDRFNEGAQTFQVATTRFSHSAVFLDYDNDGWQDLFVVNARNDIENGSNQLFRNLGGNRFEDVSGTAGIEGTPTARRRHSAAADFNNDGWTDIMVTTDGGGHHVFMNQGDGTFVDVRREVFPVQPVLSRFIAADVNDDGWVDIMFGSPSGNRLFLNDGTNNWARIALRDSSPNRQGLGARVRVTAGGLTQTKVMVPGGGSVSQGQDALLHFGLGDAAQIDEIRVTWQDGVEDVLTGQPANQLLMIGRGGGLNPPPSRFLVNAPDDAAFFDTSRTAIDFSWEPATDADAVSYTLHIRAPGTTLRFPNLTSPSLSVDTDVLGKDQVYSWSVVAWDGFSARPSTNIRTFTFGDPARAVSTITAPALFNHSLAGMESGQARFFDLDGDLDLDLFLVGSTGQQPLGGVYRATDQGVTTTTGGAEFFFKSLANTGTGLEPVLDPRLTVGDFDSDGDTDAIVTGIHRDSGEPTLTLYFNFEGSMVSGGLGAAARWGGPLEIADIDGDGDSDLLISGSTTNAPPYAAATVILERVDDTFVELATLPGAMFGDADWFDADGDGDLDLALTGDADIGNPVTAVYRNDGDSFAEITLPVPGLMFSSAAWADYDNDGLGDLLISGGALTSELLVGTTVLLRQRAPWDFEIVSTPLNQLMGGRALWGDYEGDGDLDILISGATSVLGEQIGRVFRNQEGRFVAELDFQGALNGDLVAGDYNLDGDLDFMVFGLAPDGTPSLNFFINQQVAEPVPTQQ
ncbi:MAG: VCBS repeat-containing protein [Rhodothermales bacterium]|nr:VCBS repeat-containing protein [Rhodothermales bacterium]MBO6780285.1 VCBS repeat-containing protein [Rhodothermales bacterium]